MLNPVVIVALFVVGAVLTVFLIFVLIALTYGMTLSGGVALHGTAAHRTHHPDEADAATPATPDTDPDDDTPPPLPMFTWHEKTTNSRRRG